MTAKRGNQTLSKEHQRLLEPYTGMVPPWRKWGPYVCERSWGSVREDYSADGCAWEFLTHDMARSKAYRWGEDGIAGICDRYQLLVFALAMWNGRDPILKERMFGLTGNEGNHGEDVKEYWFYLDNTPTHSYMKVLYKYPQRAFPYQQLIEENRRRWGQLGGREYELLDTGIFDDDRYFDVFVEYAKAGPEDICVRIEAINRGPEAAELHLMPHLWFRNTWAWTETPGTEPSIGLKQAGNHVALVADGTQAAAGLRNLQFPYSLGTQYLYAEKGGEAMFTDNESNQVKLYGCAENRKPHVKDAFHRHIIHHEDCLNPQPTGTKACVHYHQTVPPGGSMVLRLRLTPEKLPAPLNDVDEIVRQRKAEADEFYAAVHPPSATADEKLIQRQALAGMLWSKQIYLWDVNRWLEGDNPKLPPPESRKHMRNIHWRHLNSMRILSMPDKWEFPWFAAWDLAFHTVPFAIIDPDFARQQLRLMLREWYMAPSGQLAAYEYDFGDVNPPVLAWACRRVFTLGARTTEPEVDFLRRVVFPKLLMNFTWWVNRKDPEGDNLFSGGFLGLDNIGVFDRSAKLPGGARLEQSDATAWMAFFCNEMLAITLALTRVDPAYEEMATTFAQHFGAISQALNGEGGLWDVRRT